MSLITFYSEGKKVFGNLHLLNEKAPCVICLHGLESHKDSGKWPVFAAALNNANFSCLRFNFRGCGQGQEKSEGAFEDITLTGRIKDYMSALDFLQNQVSVDMEKLGVVGSSFGGMVAIAAKEKRVKAIVTLGSPYKIPQFEISRIQMVEEEYCTLTSGRRVKRNFYEDLEKYDILRDVRESPPLLVIHGSSDGTIPIDHAYKLHETAREPKGIKIVEGADHVFSKYKHENEAIRLSIDWFRRFL